MEVDGRRARGQASRAALISATRVVLERDGATGITHRAVSVEAGVAAATITYHFRGIDGLLRTAMEDAAERWATEMVPEGSEDFARRFAENLVDEVSHHHTRFVGDLELYLYAARRPELRDAAAAWATAVGAPLGDPDAIAARAFMAAAKGLCLDLLTADEAPDVETVAAILEHASGPIPATGPAARRGDRA